MKKLSLFTFLLFSASTYAQSITIEQAEAYSNELVNNNFLTPKGKTTILKELRANHIETYHTSPANNITYSSDELSRESILQFCSSAIIAELMNRLRGKGIEIEEKISPREPLSDSGRTYSLMPGPFANKEYDGSISTQTSVFGSTRMKTLNTFRKSGLIDEKTYNDCLSGLTSKKLRDEGELIRYMLDRSTYYRYYDFNKKEQEAYLLSLVKHGILSEDEKSKLLASYKDYELKTIPEMLKQSARYALADLHAYPAVPEVTYPVIFETVKKLLPAFRYSDLSVVVKEEQQGEFTKEEINLSFAIDTLHYAHSFFHNYKKITPTPDDIVLEVPRVDQDFHKGINKWLTDIESPFRLYTVNILDEDEMTYGSRSVGLLLLKQGEDSIITKNPYVISREVFDNRLSKKNISKLLTDLKKNGLFTHLTPSEITTAEEKVAAAEIKSMRDVLLQFPRNVVAFDWESGDLESPYKHLTEAFVAASRGAFTLHNITDEFENGWKGAKQIKYGFTMNGKRYDKMLRFTSDWLDPNFIALIKSALSEQKVNGSIYNYGDNGGVQGYIFLTADQYQFMQTSYPDLIEMD